MIVNYSKNGREKQKNFRPNGFPRILSRHCLYAGSARPARRRAPRFKGHSTHENRHFQSRNAHICKKHFCHV